MNYLAGIILTLAAIVTSVTTSYAFDKETLYISKVEEADKACAVEDWQKAEQALNDAISIDPENPGNIMLLSNLGLVRFNLGLDSLAIEALNYAHRKAPASVTILSNRARVFLSIGEEYSAYKDYSNILDLDSMDVSARFNHCLLSLRRHDFRAARTDFDFMREHFPDLEETNVACASYLSGTGDYKGAIGYYTKVLETRPEAEYFGGRAYCYLLSDRLQEASDDINMAISLSPDDGELYLYRAALNKMRYRPDDADSDARKAVGLGVDPNAASEFLKKLR